jgi:hypothetical protein
MLIGILSVNKMMAGRKGFLPAHENGFFVKRDALL